MLEAAGGKAKKRMRRLELTDMDLKPAQRAVAEQDASERPRAKGGESSAALLKSFRRNDAASEDPGPVPAKEQDMADDANLMRCQRESLRLLGQRTLPSLAEYPQSEAPRAGPA